MYELGVTIWDYPNLSASGRKDALAWLDRASSRGSVLAQRTLALEYAVDPQFQNSRLSAHYYRLAAMAGDFDAQYYFARHLVAGGEARTGSHLLAG